MNRWINDDDDDDDDDDDVKIFEEEMMIWCEAEIMMWSDVK